MQKEDNKETEEKKVKGSMAPQAQTSMVGKIHKSGWEVNMTRQDNDYVYFQVYCMGDDRDWYKLNIRCPKEKFKKM
jgi:hypothetical protein